MTPALRKQWVLDAQGTDFPKELTNIISALWEYYELGNDNCFVRLSPEQISKIVGIKSSDFQNGNWVYQDVNPIPLSEYLINLGVGYSDPVVIHWWW